MSLHDMYFSTKNKNYMYDILSKVILKESGIQIVGDERYMNLYRLNYSSVFERVSTDELSELNKEIINHIGTLILNDIQVNPIVIHDKSAEQKVVQVREEQVREQKIIYSSERLNNSLNRYNFSVHLECKEFIPKSLILIKEQNSLFSNPNINILFNDKDNLLFSLKETKKIGETEYLTYEPLLSDSITCDKNSLTIQIRNYLMIDPLTTSDIYPIERMKPIHYENQDYLCLEINNHDIEEGDELGFFVSDNNTIQIEKSVFVQKNIQNYLLVNSIDVDFSRRYSCLQMNKNITIQGLISK